ncbi:hypothetical protein [Tolypothrix sp. VBCCA 56010]|uniref:hypothetical protein n=1 Tax=Tolypothrix sp. VBCCA 56010 TaxID=3137731 RepID=UPI003D7C7E37
MGIGNNSFPFSYARCLMPHDAAMLQVGKAAIAHWLPHALCPMPHAQCPMPNAHCPLPNAHCPIPSPICDRLLKLTIKLPANVQ